MSHRLYTLLYLLFESFSARRDVQIRFLKEENRILRSRVKRRRLILSPEERSRLLGIGRELNHHVKDLISIVQYRTDKRWIKQQREGRKVGRPGRPRTIGRDIREAIVRFARENAGWGYRRIVGELLKLRCKVGKTTVRRVLREAGIYPEPGEPYSRMGDDRPWDRFLKLHINTLVACDFFCKTIWTPIGKRHVYLMLFLHVGSRKVFVSPATYHPDAKWVQQQGRNVLMWLEDHCADATHLIHNRDTKFTKEFEQLIQTANIRILKSPIQAPNANAFAEAWITTIRRECLNYLACFSLRHPDYITQTYTTFYNRCRPHQRMSNRVLRFQAEPHQDPESPAEPIGKIGCQSQLGGLLKHYYHAAA